MVVDEELTELQVPILSLGQHPHVTVGGATHVAQPLVCCTHLHGNHNIHRKVACHPLSQPNYYLFQGFPPKDLHHMFKHIKFPTKLISVIAQ